MDQKFYVLQQILDEMTEDSGFFGSIISSQEGLIIINSNQMDPMIEIESTAAKAASIFNEKGVLSDDPDSITIGYPNKKVFIQKIPLNNGEGDSFLLIIIMPNNMRYYRRKVNKLKNVATELTL